MALAATVALVLAVALIRNVAELRSETDEITHAILIVLGSALTLGFVVMPLVFATDDPLDPRRFALFGIRPRRLALVLASTGAVSVPLLLLFAILIAQMVAWSRGPLPSFLSFVTLLLVLPTCVLLGRIGSAVSSAYLSGRRAREISSAAMLALVTPFAPALAQPGAEAEAPAAAAPDDEPPARPRAPAAARPHHRVRRPGRPALRRGAGGRRPGQGGGPTGAEGAPRRATPRDPAPTCRTAPRALS
jgi:hypothetical protein